DTPCDTPCFPTRRSSDLRRRPDQRRNPTPTERPPQAVERRPLPSHLCHRPAGRRTHLRGGEGGHDSSPRRWPDPLPTLPRHLGRSEEHTSELQSRENVVC